MDINSLSLTVSNVATAAAHNAWALVGNFVALLVLTVLMIVVSYRSRGGIISLILAMYVGYAIYSVFPFTNQILAFGGTLIIKAALSILLFAVATFFPYHFIERLTGGGFGILSFVPRFALSFLAATFVLAIAYHVFDINHLYSFPQPLNELFAPNKYFFWWFIAPLVGLFFLVH
jgi:hypothetical protein